MGVAKQKPSKKISKSKKRNKRRRHHEDSEEAMSLAESLNADSESESVDDESDYTSDEAQASKKRRRNDKRPFKQAKHVFEINVKELKNIPILAKFIRESQDYNKAMITESKRLMDGRYASHQNMA
jgi:ribosomal protein L32